MMDLILDAARETWLVAAAMSPYLLLGFAVAGLLSVFISPQWLERHLGGRGLGPVFKAALFGVPLPLCSCGVIPVAASLRSHGASRAATTSFLISTPQTGVDSILVTWTMLGPLFAVFRPLAALVTGFGGGAAVQALAPGDGGADAAAGAAPPRPPAGLGPKLASAWRYGSETLPGDIGRALLIGILIAGVVGALLPEDLFARYLQPGPLSILVMMAVGIPIYVCATASVPLAASFIFLGISPGAALAFLIAGPATNAATLTTIGRVLGRRTLVVFLATIAVSAFGCGLLLDWLLPRAAELVPRLGQMPHAHEHVGWFEHLSGVFLVLIMSRSWWLSRRAPACGDAGAACCAVPSEASREDPMTTTAFTIEGMNCSHCSGSVQRAVEELTGVAACRVSLDEGRADVDGDAVDSGAVIAAIEKLGFRARPEGSD
jgi:uncharacterized membrane protein YraQ (UPF0718 family)/copper chaperone CopZ